MTLFLAPQKSHIDRLSGHVKPKIENKQKLELVNDCDLTPERCLDRNRKFDKNF